VCGVNVDPRLTQLVSDLSFLKEQGIAVERYNLKDHVKTFTEHPQVLSEMGPENEFLPIFMWDGKIICKGAYPSRDQLSKWVSVAPAAASDGGSCCSGSKCC
jgi:hypothetical protein